MLDTLGTGPGAHAPSGPAQRSSARSSSRLLRYGFVDISRAADLLGADGLRLWGPDLVASPEQPRRADGEADPGADAILDALAATADPDLALLQLHRLHEATERIDEAHEFMAALRSDATMRARLLAVLGASSAIGDHLVANPDQWRALRIDGGHDHTAPTDVASLRLAYRRDLTRIAAADLTGAADVDDTMTALSRLADTTLATAFRLAGGHADTRLAIMAMGKCGGNELNYVSDVDVIFVCADDDDPAATTPIAIKLMQICAQVAWPVDAALRPEGNRGPLVRTLGSHLAYYRKYARTWEFQALLKARPAAGDVALGNLWRDSLADLVWHAAERPEAVEDIRAMRRRIIDAVPREELDREIKRGPGGLRDIEFAVQLLQLVHGRADESLRSAVHTGGSGRADRGWLRRPGDGEALLRAYRFLRVVEHRLQLQRLRRTHTVPSTATPHDRAALRWLAQALGYRASGDRDAVAAFRADWVGHSAEVRRLHAKLLYRPLLEAVARVPSNDLRLTPKAAQSRLEVLGFADPAGALRHIQALTGGVSRTASIQHTLLAGAALRVRRRARTRPWPARLPAGVRGARIHAVVPAAAARRRPGRAAARRGAGPLPLRDRPAHPRPGSAAPARRRPGTRTPHGRRALLRLQRGRGPPRWHGSRWWEHVCRLGRTRPATPGTLPDRVRRHAARGHHRRTRGRHGPLRRHRRHARLDPEQLDVGRR